MLEAATKFLKERQQRRHERLNPTKPTPVKNGKVLELNHYTALAEEIGYKPSTTVAWELRNFLAENDMPTYALDEVWDYMNRIARREGKRWHWYPIREKDSRSFTLEFGEDTRVGWLRPQLYKKELPIHILRLISKIPVELRDKLEFYVSDYEVINPDPFLMAIPKHSEAITMITVLAVWDEPGFGLEE